MKFLNSTRKNSAYYYFGRWLDFQKPSVYPLTVYPQFNLLDAVANFNPEPSNPLQQIVSAFVEEIATTELRPYVNALPGPKREPYDSYCDTLEDHLSEVHRKNQR
jgi:hypothetical protein